MRSVSVRLFPIEFYSFFSSGWMTPEGKVHYEFLFEVTSRKVVRLLAEHSGMKYCVNRITRRSVRFFTRKTRSVPQSLS